MKYIISSTIIMMFLSSCDRPTEEVNAEVRKEEPKASESSRMPSKPISSASFKADVKPNQDLLIEEARKAVVDNLLAAKKSKDIEELKSYFSPACFDSFSNLVKQEVPLATSSPAMFFAVIRLGIPRKMEFQEAKVVDPTTSLVFFKTTFRAPQMDDPLNPITVYTDIQIQKGTDQKWLVTGFNPHEIKK